MKLLKNPFYILGATAKDNRKKLIKLFEEKSLLGNADECNEALTILTNPRKRLSAEIGMLGNSTPLEKFNAMSMDIYKNGFVDTSLDKMIYDEEDCFFANSYGHTYVKILALCNEFKQIVPYKICVAINESRIIAGFPQIEDLSIIEEELNSIRLNTMQIIYSKLNQISNDDFIEFATYIAAVDTDLSSIMLDDILNYYEIKTKQQLDDKSEKILNWIEIIKKDAVNEKFNDNSQISLLNTFIELPFTNKIEELCHLVEKWHNIAQPLQLNAQAKGLMHKDSEKIAYAVHDLAITLYNKYGQLEFSQRLINILKTTFAELDIFAERLASDISVLDDIKKKKDEELLELQLENQRKAKEDGDKATERCLEKLRIEERKLTKKRIIGWTIGIVLFFILVICLDNNTPHTTSPSSIDYDFPTITPIETITELSTPVFNEPIQMKPENGYTENFTDYERQAPFQVKTPIGEDCYYILLKDSITNKKVISLFMLPGRTTEIEVPLGNYKIYYATGKEWYGTIDFFGPDTVYSKGDDIFYFYIDGDSVMGQTVELIKQTGGNLSTSSTDKNVFSE